MKLMLNYIKRYKAFIAMNIICGFGFVLIELGLPTLLAQIVNEGVLPRDFDRVIHLGIIMAVICVIGLIGIIALAYSSSKITAFIMRDIRNDVFKKVQVYSHKEYGKFGAASLNTRTTNDVFKIMTFLQAALRIGVIAPLMLVSSLFMIIRTSPSLSWSLLGALPAIILGVIVIAKKASPLSTGQQLGLDNINMIFKESLTGLRVIRAFNNEDFQGDRFKKVNETYENVTKKLFKLMGFAQPGFMFIFTIVLGAVLIVGASLIGSMELQVGNLMAFIEYIFHAMFSTMLFANIFIMYPLAAVSANRIQEVLDSNSEIEENKESKNLITNGEVEFKNVSFSYSGEDEGNIIKNISFTAKPGETLAIIGSTGSGKSTLIQLIPRFYDISSGSVLIDGVDVKDYSIKHLRDKIGFVSQKALLFTGSIKDNLLYGNKDASIDELQHASNIAQAEDFIKNKEKGFDEFLSEGGSNLSGGQKQRLSIARAIAKKAKIYIFDDSFSALDYKTDASLRAALKEETKDSTLIIVAQRVGTIRNADKIIVLNEGEIVAEGTHRELLKNSDVYYDIAASQLSREELIRDEK